MPVGRYKIKLGTDRERMMMVSGIYDVVRKLTELERHEFRAWLNNPVKDSVWQHGNITIRCIEVLA